MRIIIVYFHAGSDAKQDNFHTDHRVDDHSPRGCRYKPAAGLCSAAVLLPTGGCSPWRPVVHGPFGLWLPINALQCLPYRSHPLCTPTGPQWRDRSWQESEVFFRFRHDQSQGRDVAAECITDDTTVLGSRSNQAVDLSD